MSMGQQEPSNVTLGMIRNPDGSLPLHLPIQHIFPKKTDTYGQVYHLLNMMVFQFLFYSHEASAFPMPLSISGYLIAIDAHVKMLISAGQIDEAAALGLYGFDAEILKAAQWNNEAGKLPYQDYREDHKELIERFSGDQQLGIFKTQPLQSHAINTMFLRLDGQVFVPTLALVNLLLSIDASYRYKNNQSICLGEWYPHTIEAKDIAPGLTH